MNYTNSKFLILKNDLDVEVSEFLDYLIETGGPELPDYDKFTSIVNNLNLLRSTISEIK